MQSDHPRFPTRPPARSAPTPTGGARIALLVAGFALAACNTTGGPSSREPASPSLVAAAGPTSCAKPIADFATIIDADVKTGNLDRKVYRRASSDLNGVRTTCAAGDSGSALAALANVKARYGYR